MNEKIGIVFGYGKTWNYKEEQYLKYALKVAKKGGISLLVMTGGDTTNKSNGPWQTEAEMLRIKMEELISQKNLDIRVVEENEAYNTPTNLLYSLRMALGYRTEKIFIVCNRAHLAKVFFSSIKILGLEATKNMIVFCPFLLTTRFSENVKTYLKMPIEIFGYFYRPFGCYLEYWQMKLRTGRNERPGYWKFRVKYRRELI